MTVSNQTGIERSRQKRGRDLFYEKEHYNAFICGYFLYADHRLRHGGR